jgi:cytochrome c peroxidase
MNFIFKKKFIVKFIVPIIIAIVSITFGSTDTKAQVAPLSLKDVPVVLPTNLQAFLKGNPGSTEAAQAKQKAIVLGKALFWDMQVGSDNVQACASCHFNCNAPHLANAF